MKRTLRKTISFILTLALLLGMVIVPVSAVGPITVSSRMETDVVRGSDGKQVYKLIFSVYSATGLNTMASAVSYDNTVIVPVNQGTKADVTALDDGGVFAAPLKILLVDEGFSLYSAATRSSYVNGGRTAFKCEGDLEKN